MAKLYAPQVERYAHRLGRFNYSVNKSDELSPRSKAMMGFAAETLWLLYFNDYAYKQGVISEQIYRRMKLAIRTRKKTWREVKD